MKQNLLLIFLVFYSVFCIITGAVYKISPPKYTPDIYGEKTFRWGSGYKTPASKKSQESWYKAQKFFGQYLFITGVLLFLAFCFLGLIGIRYLWKISTIEIIFIVFMCMQLIGCIIYCELKLRN